jgi:hypothetical protein
MKLIYTWVLSVQCYTKYISRLLGISAAGEHCVLATRSEDNTSDGGRYGLILCNAIGTPVDSKFAGTADSKNNIVYIPFLVFQQNT